jgi:hypothetical protein
MLANCWQPDKENPGMTLEQAIDAFARGPADLRHAYRGLLDADLNARPADGSWTLQQIAFHMAHSDAIGIDRMLRIAFEKSPPLLIGYDETSGTEAVFSDGHPLEELLLIFELNRKTFTRVLKRLPREVFAKFGIHNEAGKVTLSEMVEKYVKHLDHHLAFIEKKRPR